MTDPTVISILVAIVLAFTAIAVATALLSLITNRGKGKPGSLQATIDASPSVQAVLDAIKPYCFQAIWAAEKLALATEQQIGTSIAGLDKKAIADSVYNLLPQELTIGGVTVKSDFIKTLIPKAQFEILVQNLYEQGLAFLLANESYLKAQIDIVAPQPIMTPVGLSVLPNDGLALSNGPLPTARVPNPPPYTDVPGITSSPAVSKG